MARPRGTPSPLRRTRPLFFVASVAFVALAFAPQRASAECVASDVAAIEVAKTGDTFRSSNLDGAIERYEEAHRVAPANARITLKLANAYTKKEDWASLARLTATSCPAKDARCAFLGGVAIARLAARGGAATWADARAKLEAALAIDPALEDAHVELADVALRLQDPQAALNHYTAAIRLRPDDRQVYAMLADLCVRLQLLDHATRVIEQGLTWNDSFVLRTLYGLVKDRRADSAGALEQYVLAKKACGACSERGEQLATFNLGAAYATARPPQASLAIENLHGFYVRVCKGALAAKYQDQCTEAQALARMLGGAL